MASLLPFNKLLFPRIAFFFFRFGVICFFANLIFLSSPTVSSTERSKVASGLKVWVFFSDKGIDNQSLSPKSPGTPKFVNFHQNSSILKKTIFFLLPAKEKRRTQLNMVWQKNK